MQLFKIIAGHRRGPLSQRFAALYRGIAPAAPVVVAALYVCRENVTKAQCAEFEKKTIVSTIYASIAVPCTSAVRFCS